ncbi:MAG: alpha/beta hydrolase [Pseudomonadales bacterium]|nr:alpha/beta hydrolase [Pseudomonadales bacterium]
MLISRDPEISMERFLNNDGTRIWTTSGGKGMPSIFINGGPGCDDYLEPVSRMIEDRCQVVRFEPRGCGRSDYDGRYDMDTTLADIDFVRREYGFDRALLLGHSAGPDLALAFAMQWPERVSGIIGIAGGRIVNDRDWHETYHRSKETVGDAIPKAFVA